jgi:hypothetical protein
MTEQYHYDKRVLGANGADPCTTLAWEASPTGAHDQLIRAVAA